jgi:hypothetical protein
MRLSAVSKQLEFGAREGRVDQEAVEEAKALWPQTVASLGARG